MINKMKKKLTTRKVRKLDPIMFGLKYMVFTVFISESKLKNQDIFVNEIN